MTTTSRTRQRPDFVLPAPDIAGDERGLAALVRHSAIECRRLLTGWLRDPSTLIQALAYPALTLVMFRVVLGDSISAATGQPSVYGTVPMTALVGGMAGAMVSALGFGAERATGLVGRMWTLPVHRWSGLTGRMLAETVRMLATTGLIVIVGVALGFRFHEGPWAIVGFFLVPLGFGLSFSVAVTALSTMSKAGQLVQIVGIVTMLMTFFNTGFVPLMAYPPWLQDIVAHQPMSPAIEAMKGLTRGGPVAGPVTESVLWSLATIALFALPAVRGYRRAAGTG